jgi:lysophospholipase L1-like esterase
MSYVNTQEVGRVRKSIRANLNLIILNLIIIFIVSFAVVKTHALYENSLSVHPQWIATKPTLRRGVNGALEFVLRPQALTRNQLNLGAWFGFQEVLYRDELDLSQIEFRFRAEDGGYLHVLYDYRSGGFSGVRLSSNSMFPNLSYDATTDGEFTKIKDFSLQPLTPNVWHQARLIFMNDSVVVTLDGLRIGVFQRLPGSQRIGFRGGRSNVWIDEVILTGRDGQVRTERFTNMQRQYQRLVFVFAGMLVLTIAWLIAALKLRTYTTSLRHIGMGIGLAVSLLGCLVGALYLLQYVRGGDFPRISNDEARRKEAYFINNRLNERLAEIRSRYSAEVPPNVFRLLILGSSQTWGAGAKADEDTWVRQLESRLNASAHGPQVECINAGVSALRAAGILQMVRTELGDMKATAAIVNLSNNDPVTTFAQDLDELVRELISRNIRPVLMLEANSLEGRQNADLETKHAVARVVAAHHGLPVIDMEAYLAQRKDAGFLWWDFVHLTSFGQRLVADKLAIDLPQLLDMDPADYPRRTWKSGASELAPERRPPL